MKYLLKDGTITTEENLQDTFRQVNFTTYNERDFEAWLCRLVIEGVIELIP